MLEHEAGRKSYHLLSSLVSANVRGEPIIEIRFICSYSQKFYVVQAQ